MGDLIKIVGVQYAVNSNHVKGEDMTAQEQQKTIEFLTMLARKHPYVSVKPEPTNETDEEAFVACVASRKAGYVRNREEYKSLAQAALTTSGRGYFRARVKEVIISAEGYFFVEAETDSTPIVPILHKDHWKEWEPPLPLFPMTEEFLCVEDATMMMIDILRHETLTSDEEEELQEYTETLITMGKYALWYEAKEGIENVIKAMEAKKGDKMRYMANDLRKGSKTFGKYVMVELSGENKRQFFIPRGFAHGFLVLSDEVIFTYKVDNVYAPDYEASIHWDDPTIGIKWPIEGVEVLTSEKDRTKAKSFEEADYFE